MEILHHIGGVRKARKEIMEILKDYPATDDDHSRNRWVRSSLLRVIGGLFETESDLIQIERDYVETSLQTEIDEFRSTEYKEG